MILFAKFGMGLSAFFSTLGLERIIASVNWSSTITLGSVILAIIVALSTLAFVGWGVKYKTAYEAETAIVDSLKEGREAYRLRAERMEEENERLVKEVIACKEALIETKSKMAKLEERPDLDKVLQIVGENLVRQDSSAENRMERVLDVFTKDIREHDKAARERQEEILRRLDKNRS